MFRIPFVPFLHVPLWPGSNFVVHTERLNFTSLTILDSLDGIIIMPVHVHVQRTSTWEQNSHLKWMIHCTSRPHSSEIGTCVGMSRWCVCLCVCKREGRREGEREGGREGGREFVCVCVCVCVYSNYRHHIL